MKKLVSLFIILSMLFGLAACGTQENTPQDSAPIDSGSSSNADSSESIRIGALFPMTGSNAVWGSQTYYGVDIAVEMINERGGINGRQVEVILADAPDTTSAVSEAERLINNEGLDIIVGTQSSGIANPASAVAEENGVIYYEVCATADALTERGFQYFFRFNTAAKFIGLQQIEVVQDLIAPSLGVDVSDLVVAVIYEDSAYGASVGTAAIAAAEEYGIDVAVTETYTSATVTDLSSLIISLKEQDVDIILGAVGVTDGILFWRQCEENDYTPKAWLAAGGVSNTEFVAAFEEKADGVFVVDTPTALSVPEAALNEDVLELKNEYIERYTKKYGEDQMSGNSDLGFAGAWSLFVDILPNAASYEPDDVRAAFLSADTDYGSTILNYGVQYDAAGQNMRTLSTVTQWQNGERVAVYPESFAVGEPILLPLPVWGDR